MNGEIWKIKIKEKIQNFAICNKLLEYPLDTIHKNAYKIIEMITNEELLSTE